MQRALLSNTKGLLAEAGKEIRHVRMQNLGDIDQAALRMLLQGAHVLKKQRKS